MKTSFTSKCIMRLFGWRVYISRQRMVLKPRAKHSVMKKARRAVYEENKHKCMECGAEIPYENVRINSKLDASFPVEQRYAKDNVILLCPKCNANYQYLKQNKIWQTSAMKNNIDND